MKKEINESKKSSYSDFLGTGEMKGEYINLYELRPMKYQNVTNEIVFKICSIWRQYLWVAFNKYFLKTNHLLNNWKRTINQEW